MNSASTTDWELFRIQTIKAAGLEGHPKANEFYSWCWERYGHYGNDAKEEILHAMCDMAEIELGVE